MQVLLQTRGLQAFYGTTQALFGVDLSVEARGITALLGANGAGKTTILRAVCGMLRTQGEITFDGKSIRGMATESIVRLGIAHVPDGRGTFTDLSVEENLKLGAYLRSNRADVASDLDRVFTYFPVLKQRFHQQAGTLSGGEQQMLAISRALMSRPRLMLLVEPSFGLAPLIVQEIFRIMRRINEEEGVGMLLVEQNAKLALELAGQAFLLETGKVVVAGEASAMVDDEGVRRAYLGY